MLKEYGAYKGIKLPNLGIKAQCDVPHEKGDLSIHNGKERPECDDRKILVLLNTEAGLITIECRRDAYFDTGFNHED